MAVKVFFSLPSPLKEMAGGITEMDCRGGTVKEAVMELQEERPALRDKILDKEGKIDKGFFIFLNKLNLRDTGGLDAIIHEGDVIRVLPIAAGG
jgi:molybdopterin converting factor small subunit